MLRKNLLIKVLLITILLSAFIGEAYAVTAPTFPVCANPQGQVKASYDSGAHGVAGNTSAFTGKDTVYTLTDETLTQCLCTTDGEGIQTNWWKVSNLTQDEKNILISQGWISIPDGSAWGLDQGPYLAKNSNYACASSDRIGGTANAGSVLGTSTETVLGLATTGNILFILTVILTGFILLGSGASLSLKKKK